MKTTQINGFTQVTIGSIRFFLNPENLELKEMASRIGFDLQKRKVLDFEEEHDQIVNFLEGASEPSIITRSVFRK